MAGGVTGDIRTPYPKGGGSLVLIQFAPFAAIASKTAIVDEHTTRFAFKPKFAEITGSFITIANSMAITIQDDTGSPKLIVSAQQATVVVVETGGSGSLAIANKELIINAGAVLVLKVVTGANDVSLNAVVRLWVEPVF